MNEEALNRDMAGFYQRALGKLPTSPKFEPFEVKVFSQKTEQSSRQLQSNEVPIVEDEIQGTLGPAPPGITSVLPDKVSSAGGTSVTIFGSNFVDGSTVKIAGISASSVVFVDSGRITCTTPADGLGWMTVEVTAPSGQVATKTSAILYVDWPDNVLISGPTRVQAATTGSSPNPHVYNYTATLRIGTTVFNIPIGVTIYFSLFRTRYGPTAGSTVNPYGEYFSGQVATLDHASSPTVNFSISLWGFTGEGIGLTCQVAHASAIAPPPFPIYGDPLNAPNQFLIQFTSDGAPPPSGTYPDRFSFEDLGRGGSQPNVGTWGWVSADSKTIRVKRLNSDGSLNTGFNGTATISWTRYGGSAGELSVSIAGGNTALVTFTSGVVTFSVYAQYTFTNVSNSQAIGYFTLHAADGTVVGDANGACLNHL